MNDAIPKNELGDDSKRVVFIVGPTASNKSALALKIARRFDGEIVNADAFQVYKGFDIGTAKAGIGERKQVKHHLIDILAPTDKYNVSQFIQDATRAIGDIHARRKAPIVVGGSGQYIKALAEGWKIPKVAPNPSLRAEFERILAQDGLDALVKKLSKLNPAAARRIDASNPRRVIRALERTLGAPGDATPKSNAKPAFKTLIIGSLIGRGALHRRVESRIAEMFAAGWVDEVRGLLNQGVPPSAPAMAAIGYRAIADYILGDSVALEEVVASIKISTNRLIRHQNNWFKPTDKSIRWIDYEDSAAALRLIAKSV